MVCHHSHISPGLDFLVSAESDYGRNYWEYEIEKGHVRYPGL